MKRYLSWLLALTLLLSCLAVNAMALGYNPIQNTEPTFETLAEARANGPAAVQNLETNTTKTFISHPVLDGIPDGTVYIYRSAGMFGGRAAQRLNTDIVVYVDQAFDKDGALAYLKDLGLIDIIDEAVGSVVLVTPANGTAFGSVDQANYYKLQTAMLAQKASMRDEEGNTLSFCDAEYFGGYGYLYEIGIEGGATFLNNYVATQFDFASRIAGLLLIGGKMDKIRDIATFIPVYMVNADAGVLAKYKAANGVDASIIAAAADTYYNQAFPLRKVIIAKEDKGIADYIKDAYYGMFIKAMRVPVLARGLYTAGTPYQGYNFDEAPYSLCDRNAVINGKTADGIYLFMRQEDRFAEFATESGEYLETWFEYLPEEVLNNTAPEHSIPLILGNHGSQDDPRLFVDEQGYLVLIGKERIAMVAPEHQYIGAVRADALKALVEYMLDTYPALDPSRVYVTGYSMGGGATFTVSAAHPELFAATIPMAMASDVVSEEQAAVFAELDLPFLLSTSSYDLARVFDSTNQVIADGAIGALNLYLRLNEIDYQIDLENKDYDAYPISGFPCDVLTTKTLNGEYENNTWMFLKDGVPMVGITVTDGLVHALYPEYSKLMWDFAKHYSRDQETGEIIYNPYVD